MIDPPNAAGQSLALADRWPMPSELDAAVDGFYESTFGKPWDSYETGDLVHHIAWFGGTTEDGHMFTWDADRIVAFLTYVPERLDFADIARMAMFPALLRGWVRYSGAEDGTAPLEVRRSLAAIEHAEPVFFDAIAQTLYDVRPGNGDDVFVS